MEWTHRVSAAVTSAAAVEKRTSKTAVALAAVARRRVCRIGGCRIGGYRIHSPASRYRRAIAQRPAAPPLFRTRSAHVLMQATPQSRPSSSRLLHRSALPCCCPPRAATRHSALLHLLHCFPPAVLPSEPLAGRQERAPVRTRAHTRQSATLRLARARCSSLAVQLTVGCNKPAARGMAHGEQRRHSHRCSCSLGAASRAEQACSLARTVLGRSVATGSSPLRLHRLALGLCAAASADLPTHRRAMSARHAAQRPPRAAW